MAKKSAKSKGFRKYETKKPYISKQDIIKVCCLLVLLGIGAFFLFRYDDGALKVQNGTVVTGGDNWLIVDGSKAQGRARYFKLGEIGEIDGYARKKQALVTDANIPEYVFTPESDDTGVSSITVVTSHNTSEVLAKYAMTAIGEMDGTEIGELQTADMGGRKVYCYTYITDREAAGASEGTSEETPAETASEEAPAEETAEAASEEAPAEETADAAAESEAPAADRFSKFLVGYTDASNDSCIVFRVNSAGATAEACLSDEAMTAALERALAAVTLVEAK